MNNTKKTQVEVTDQQYRHGEDVWSMSRLIHLSSGFTPYTLPIKHLNVKGIFGDEASTYEIVKQIKETLDVDMTSPIIIDQDGAIVDGRRRVLKAMLTGIESVQAVKFETGLPEPDFSVDQDDNAGWAKFGQ